MNADYQNYKKVSIRINGHITLGELKGYIDTMENNFSEYAIVHDLDLQFYLERVE